MSEKEVLKEKFVTNEYKGEQYSGVFNRRKQGNGDKNTVISLDVPLLKEVIFNKKDAQQIATDRKEVKGPIETSILIHAKLMNKVLDAGINSQVITIPNIIGKHNAVWRQYLELYIQTYRLSQLDPIDRFIEYFRTLDGYEMKDVIERLIHEYKKT